MNYYEQDDGKGKKWGIAGVVLYAVVCTAVMFITHTFTPPEPEMGILIDFGTSEAGSGEEDLAAGDIDSRPATPPRPETLSEPFITTDDPRVTVEVLEPKPETRPATPVPEPVPVREIDRRTLFPGRTEGSAATSQGTAGGEGNQGTKEGAPGGSDTTGGASTSGFSLAGRYLAGNLPRPAYEVQVEGRVVIAITVDAEGKVTNAAYQQAGSTTNHGELVGAARAAALKARFTPSEEPVATGTITYIFRLD